MKADVSSVSPSSEQNKELWVALHLYGEWWSSLPDSFSTVPWTIVLERLPGFLCGQSNLVSTVVRDIPLGQRFVSGWSRRYVRLVTIGKILFLCDGILRLLKLINRIKNKWDSLKRIGPKAIG